MVGCDNNIIIMDLPFCITRELNTSKYFPFAEKKKWERGGRGGREEERREDDGGFFLRTSARKTDDDREMAGRMVQTGTVVFLVSVKIFIIVYRLSTRHCITGWAGLMGNERERERE